MSLKRPKPSGLVRCAETAADIEAVCDADDSGRSFDAPTFEAVCDADDIEWSVEVHAPKTPKGPSFDEPSEL